MKDIQELVDDFKKDAEARGFKCVPHIVCLLIYDKKCDDDDLCIRLDFPFAHSAHIYTMYDKRAEDLERYSWLFSRVAELFRDLKKWSTSDEA